MKLICDTNIILDVVLRQEPFYAASAQALILCESQDVEGCIAASSLTDIYYIVHKVSHDSETAYQALEMVSRILKICDVTASDAKAAIDKKHRDFEDSLIALTGVSLGCDYILTRNTKDFQGYAIPPITPDELLEMFP